MKIITKKHQKKNAQNSDKSVIFSFGRKKVAYHCYVKSVNNLERIISCQSFNAYISKTRKQTLQFFSIILVPLIIYNQFITIFFKACYCETK